jgi:hypothetical protein
MLKPCLFTLGHLVGASIAHSQTRVHSDLPLFDGRHGELWPRGFVEKDSWGCTSKIAFGDWKYVEPKGDGSDPLVKWLRLRNYGVFHCAVIEEWAEDRQDLGRRGFEYSWFVELGKAKRGGSPIEIWTLQSGVRPGSDYILLSRTPAPGLIKSFNVLAVDCPRANRRGGERVDVWRTDYCAINSVTALKNFAKMMTRQPVVATLTWIGTTSKDQESRE